MTLYYLSFNKMSTEEAIRHQTAVCEKNFKITLDILTLLCYTSPCPQPIRVETNIWGYSSAGSPVEAVTHPSKKLNKKYPAHPLIWGYSSAGRALEWHSRGQRFDPAYLHHRVRWIFLDNLSCFKASFFFAYFLLEIGFCFYAAIATMSSPPVNCSKSILKSMCSL